MCLGKVWALMEMQLIVATVAQKAGIVLRPKGRLLMALITYCTSFRVRPWLMPCATSRKT